MALALWRVICRFLSALALRLVVAVAYAAGFNALIFLPLQDLRAQPLRGAVAKEKTEAAAAADGLAEWFVSPAANAVGGRQLSDSLKSLRQQQRLAQASNAAAQAPAEAPNAAGAGAATSDFAPAGGVDLGHVDPGTGKLSFKGPIASLGGATTPPFSLTAAYSSTQVYETAINWNYEQVPSEIGLGFSLPAAHLRIARLASSTGVAWNDSFMLMTEGSDSFNNYDGSDVSADHCEFGPVEVDVRWGAWTGSSMNTLNQEQFATSWYLSAREGLSGLRTTLFYGRHTQDVGAQDSTNSNRISDALSFTKASYLYHVVSDDGDDLVLNWGGRSNTEVIDPRSINIEPDGYQEKYQILFLSSVTKASGGTYSSTSGFTVDPTPLMQVELNYNNEVLLGFDNTLQLMGKRILTEITPSYYNFYKTAANGGKASYDPQPSFSFSYWGQSKTQQTANGVVLENDDGVSVSRWNDEKGFNADNGALYGLLKTVTKMGREFSRQCCLPSLCDDC